MSCLPLSVDATCTEWYLLSVKLACKVSLAWHQLTANLGLPSTRHDAQKKLREYRVSNLETYSRDPRVNSGLWPSGWLLFPKLLNCIFRIKFGYTWLCVDSIYRQNFLRRVLYDSQYFILERFCRLSKHKGIQVTISIHKWIVNTINM